MRPAMPSKLRRAVFVPHDFYRSLAAVHLSDDHIHRRREVIVVVVKRHPRGILVSPMERIILAVSFNHLSV